MTEYILKSEKTGDYLVMSGIYTPLWTSTITYATVWKSYNPIRFIIKWYINFIYKSEVSFKKVAVLKAVINPQSFKAKGG